MGKIYERRLEQPTPNVSLGEVILNKLRENNDHIYAIDGPTGNQMTCRELLEKSVKLAKFLQRYGIKIGDRIAIATENRLNWLIPGCAISYLGAIIAPYNPSYREYEFQHMLSIAKPRIVFVSERTESVLAKLLPQLSWKMELIQLDDQSLTANVRTLTDILNNEPDVNYMEYKPTDIDDTSRHPWAILSSSGTTGLPKGVTLSHKNLIAFLVKMREPEYLDARSGDKMLMLLPFYHGYGIGTMMIGLISRCTMIIMSAFEPKLFLTLVQKHKVTHLPVVPPILTFLAKHPLVDRYDFRSVRELVCGAAPLGKDVVTAVKTRLGVKYIRNGYGMTELSIVSGVSGRNDDDNDDSFENPGTGLLVPGFLGKVVDLETQETLEAGQMGEICYMGEQVMLGYWNNPEATKQTIDQDGWLHTGDIGYFDNKNRLHVIDRVKELIKYKGYQVAPSEIETVLLSHQAIKDAAVTSKPDERNGEVPVAFIVKQPDATITAQDVQEFIKQKLSEQKWLHGGVQFVDAIPKNPSGKILRRELRTMISKL
ncbi:PREDICTED: 4-coumarate--CoA ligase 1-like [Trachymyrmex cornetzi]|uniref:4-coumarate--CoA ligase 1-like n=1 Tax=Trachymyrmex cornetzi TaxID=471704 RepID=UPI00084EF3C4|nr:PREDICTED: 4-coumarate--CoA ligase 1-like [Trachymyrmex cornetzi]XP_018364961.1 PREDICTED: 4-coumarate--CoA ligase 1-like [Trachymyrmex cornetzi]XP_018364962.1 PREDICTED: 4-coumarate--CoA ligase 1-like [Trachymyrmex cornetzi]